MFLTNFLKSVGILIEILTTNFIDNSNTVYKSYNIPIALININKCVIFYTFIWFVLWYYVSILKIRIKILSK